MRLSALIISSILFIGSAVAQPTPDLAPEADEPQVNDLETLLPESDSDIGPREVVRENAQAELETLFEKLASAESPTSANPIAYKIQRIWLDSGSDAVDLLMDRAADAMAANQLALALDLLDHVVTLRPEFAEGWNRRATIFYMQEDYGRSLSDIERVLALEPRHWGALSGLAIIQRRLGDDKRALETFRSALAIHPGLEASREAMEKLEKAAAGVAI
ncbi:MAG: tetratricopeptide repeat protein [Rhodobacteraceae bacterium]|nr:tetratricopeptide repeat protein [Paracoccaceae bacterium]